MRKAEEERATQPEANDERDEELCCICIQPITQEAPGGRAELRREELRACGHAFHLACILRWVVRNPKCPLCAAPTFNLAPPNPVDSDAAQRFVEQTFGLVGRGDALEWNVVWREWDTPEDRTEERRNRPDAFFGPERVRIDPLRIRLKSAESAGERVLVEYVRQATGPAQITRPCDMAALRQSVFDNSLSGERRTRALLAMGSVMHHKRDDPTFVAEDVYAFGGGVLLVTSRLNDTEPPRFRRFHTPTVQAASWHAYAFLLLFMSFDQTLSDEDHVFHMAHVPSADDYSAEQAVANYNAMPAMLQSLFVIRPCLFRGHSQPTSTRFGVELRWRHIGAEWPGCELWEIEGATEGIVGSRA